jgi:hypothetical protein
VLNRVNDFGQHSLGPAKAELVKLDDHRMALLVDVPPSARVMVLIALDNCCGEVSESGYLQEPGLLKEPN